MAETLIRWDRELFNVVLAYHSKTSIKGCTCGWSGLGLPHGEHVADEYERMINLNRTGPQAAAYYDRLRRARG